MESSSSSKRKHYRRHKQENTDSSRSSSPSSDRSDARDRSRRRDRDDRIKSPKRRSQSRSPTCKKAHSKESSHKDKRESQSRRNYRRRSRSRSPRGGDRKFRNSSHCPERHSKLRDRSGSAERTQSSSHRDRSLNHSGHRSEGRREHRNKNKSGGSRDDRSTARTSTEKGTNRHRDDIFGSTSEHPKQKSIEHPCSSSPSASCAKPVPPPPMTSARSSPTSAIAIAKAAAAAVTAASLGNVATAAPELPSYYNPAAINVTKYTNQIQKRKLLWSNKDPQQNVDKWQQQAQFSQDDDGKVASKFMRLMGIKKGTDSSDTTTSAVTAAETEQGSRNPSEFAKKQTEMLNKMEQQYEVARQATHTMRGMGLGFSRQY